MENNNQIQIQGFHEYKASSSSSQRSSPYPPGFRFMPTDKELLQYLMMKVNNPLIRVPEITQVHIYDYPPQYLAENNPGVGNNQWYFFTQRDKKYLGGKRPDRAVGKIGHWRASAADKAILSGNDVIGTKRPLVYYEGKTKSKKTNWLMHEYMLNIPSTTPCKNTKRMEDWVLCRISHKTRRSNNRGKYVDDRDVSENIEILASPLVLDNNINNVSIERTNSYAPELENYVQNYRHQDTGFNENSQALASTLQDDNNINDIFIQRNDYLYRDLQNRLNPESSRQDYDQVPDNGDHDQYRLTQYSEDNNNIRDGQYDHERPLMMTIGNSRDNIHNDQQQHQDPGFNNQMQLVSPSDRMNFYGHCDEVSYDHQTLMDDQQVFLWPGSEIEMI